MRNVGCCEADMLLCRREGPPKAEAAPSTPDPARAIPPPRPAADEAARDGEGRLDQAAERREGISGGGELLDTACRLALTPLPPLECGNLAIAKSEPEGSPSEEEAARSTSGREADAAENGFG